MDDSWLMVKNLSVKFKYIKGINLSKNAIDNIGRSDGMYTQNDTHKDWKWDTPNGGEDLTWLIK